MTAAFAVARLDEIPPTDDRGGQGWIRVRHHFGIQAFGVNAWTADEGRELINEHDEEDGDEELYFVVAGQARFKIGRDLVDAPAGTLVFVRPGTTRSAVAAAPATTVLVVGSPPSAAYSSSEWEVWFPAYNAGDFDAAADMLAAVLARRPDDSRILYNLACCESRAGRSDAALEHLSRAVELRPALVELARGDADFDAVRDRAEFASLIAGQADAGGAGA